VRKIEEKKRQTLVGMRKTRTHDCKYLSGTSVRVAVDLAILVRNKFEYARPENFQLRQSAKIGTVCVEF
jgi:hypothetical protein